MKMITLMVMTLTMSVSIKPKKNSVFVHTQQYYKICHKNDAVSTFDRILFYNAVILNMKKYVSPNILYFYIKLYLLIKAMFCA